jgi:hypothetical protein
MTEGQLRRLKDLPVPPPSEGAREAAVAAALAVFQPAAAGALFDAPQGKHVPPRLRNTSSISEGSTKMRFRRPVAIAASIVALALCVASTLQLMRTPEPDVALRRPARTVVAVIPVGKPPESELHRMVEWQKKASVEVLVEYGAGEFSPLPQETQQSRDRFVVAVGEICIDTILHRAESQLLEPRSL